MYTNSSSVILQIIKLTKYDKTAFSSTAVPSDTGNTSLLCYKHQAANAV
jgi:hypothetical protein